MLVNSLAYVQATTEALDHVLGLSVCVVDQSLRVLAATGKLQPLSGTQLAPGTPHAHVQDRHCSLVIGTPRRHQLCAECQGRDGCKVTAELYSPIAGVDQVYGSVSLAAFSQREREYLLSRQSQLLALLGFLGTAFIAASRQSSMQAAREGLEMQFQEALNLSPSAMLALDREGTVVAANDIARSIVGTRGHLIGMAICDVIPGLSFAALVSSRSFRAEVPAEGRDGTLFIRARPVIQHGRVEGAVLAVDQKPDGFAGAMDNPTSGLLTFDDIKGTSDVLQQVKERARRVAGTTATVLLVGESGTGKEMFARAIHAESPRRGGPFVAINCAAIPESLLESEVFGYDAGAFTGARRGGKPGRFELANGGTLFLDEIGDMSLTLQAKFLRVLEERKVERVGGTTTVPVDVRIIAATNRNLEELVAAGKFREDLYYRLNVVPLVLPPLRDRKEDLYVLIEHYLKKYRLALGKEPKRFSAAAINALFAYDWPGNIRELANTIEYVMNLETGPVVEVDGLPAWLVRNCQREKPAPAGLPARRGQNPVAGISLKELEQDALRLALNEYGWTTEGKRAAARALGISLATLYRRLKQGNLDDRAIAN